jgi:hypothetical protein
MPHSSNRVIGRRILAVQLALAVELWAANGAIAAERMVMPVTDNWKRILLKYLPGTQINGLEVELPSGSFVLEEAIDIPDGIVLRGRPDQSTRITLANRFRGRAAFCGRDITSAEFSEINFSGDGEWRARETEAIYLEGPKRCGEAKNRVRVSNCSFANLIGKAMAIQCKGLSNCRIENCRFRDIGAAPYFHAIYLRRVAECTVSACTFDHIRGAAIKAQSVDCGDKIEIANCNVNGAWRGVHLQDTGDVLLSGCLFSNITQYGASFTIEVEHAMQTLSHVERCRFFSSGRAHIFAGAGDLIFRDCEFGSAPTLLHARFGTTRFDDCGIATKLIGYLVEQSKTTGVGAARFRRTRADSSLEQVRISVASRRYSVDILAHN